MAGEWLDVAELDQWRGLRYGYKQRNFHICCRENDKFGFIFDGFRLVFDLELFFGFVACGCPSLIGFWLDLDFGCSSFDRF